MEKSAIILFALIFLFIFFDTIKFGFFLSLENLDGLKPVDKPRFESFLRRWKIYKPVLIACAALVVIINYFYGANRNLYFLPIASAAALFVLYHLLVYNVKTNLPNP